MKRAFSILLLTGLSLCFSHFSFGQARLHIVELENFPEFPGDTAFEGPVYSTIQIQVANTGNVSFFGDIHVFLYSQTIGISGMDTLRDDPLHQNYFLPPGDTVTIPANPFYTFKSVHYAAGDNIIVVWPYSGPTDFDTYNSRVYFASIVGINEHDLQTLSIFPTPVSKILHLNYRDENEVEQVRIYDLTGRVIFNLRKAVKTIDVSGYGTGIYFLDMTMKDNSRVVKKIIVATN